MPRIALIHATPLSVEPILAAFRTRWPEASPVGILDDALAPDKAAAGTPMHARLRALTDYALLLEPAAILFTCSAFGAEIDAARAGRAIPILKPNEAMFDAALVQGARIGLLATFGPSVPSLAAEFDAHAATQRRVVTLHAAHVPDAFAALQAGDAARHDALIAAAATRLPAVDVVMLGQFSMARAAAVVASVLPGVRVLTSPGSAVDALRARLAPTPSA